MEQRDLLENIQCHSELDHSKSKWFLKAIVLSTGCAVKLPSDSVSVPHNPCLEGGSEETAVGDIGLVSLWFVGR